MKRLVAALAAGTLALTLGACSSTNSSESDAEGLTVATSFYPLAWLIESIGGDDVTVISMTPANVEPHDYELSPSDIAKMNEADLVVYVEGFQPSMDAAVEQISGPEVLELSDSVGLLPLEEDHGDDDEAHEHDHGNLDPHFWLDPERMSDAGEAIEESLSQADSANATTYQEGQETVAGQLTDLDTEFADGLATCERQTIVTTHAAFGYLTNRYGLTQVAISGIDPEAEPSPADLAAIKTTIKDTATTTIFTEELASPKTAQAVAGETGADLATLNPLESKPEDGDYVSGMEANLAALQGALGCNQTR
ncbi:metal ABC transporter substrate-binding protein [Ancrocorticia populi]|uniref:metal ABC transporter substrate-binding protein n=1 Tax=Ancrocorticia populi TaxID=2175228 RepID=UPI003F91BCA7